MLFIGQTPYRNSISMATPEVPGNEKTIWKAVLYVKTKGYEVSASYTVSELY